MAGYSNLDHYGGSPIQVSTPVSSKAQPRQSINDAKKERTDYRVLRSRLKDMIESTIGREVFRRTGHPINYIKSDPDAPNGFQWVFSDQYLEFPHTALSDFRHDDVEDCNAALDADQLRVVQVVPTTERSESESVRKGILSREAMIRSVRENILRLIEEETGLLESVDDVPEILTQRSIIMDGLVWKRRHDYQFPFSGPNPNMNKLQLTNWSNIELEDTLRAIHTGSLKLVRQNAVGSTVQEDRVLRRKDRPRRNPGRESIGGICHTSSASSRPRPPPATAGSSSIADHDDDEHGKRFESSLGAAKSEEDQEIIKLLETQMLKRRMALHSAQERIKRLQDLVDTKETYIEARNTQIKQLEVQLQEAAEKVTEKAAQELATEQDATTSEEDSQADAKSAHDGPTLCPTCTLDPSAIIDLQEKERKNVERIMDMIDRQRDLEKQLAMKTAEVDKARQKGVDEGKKAEQERHMSTHAHIASSPQPSDADRNGIPPRYNSHSRIGDSDGSSLDSRVNSSSSYAAWSGFQEKPTRKKSETKADIHPFASSQTHGSSHQRQVIFQGHFSQEFLNHLVGGNEQLFSSPSDGTVLDKKVAGLEKLITINCEYQLRAPAHAGKDGTVFLVDGDPAHNKTHGIHPTLVSLADGSYSYIGNYDTTSTHIVSLEIWKTWPINTQRVFAKAVLKNVWGTKLLAEKDLLSKVHSNSEEGKIKEVLSFFGRASTPCLRIRSYSLRYAFFSKTDHEDLCSAWEIFSARPPHTREPLNEVPSRSDIENTFCRQARNRLTDGEPSSQSAMKRKAMSEAPQQTVNKRQREL